MIGTGLDSKKKENNDSVKAVKYHEQLALASVVDPRELGSNLGVDKMFSDSVVISF